MSDWEDDALAGIGGSRPLPPELRNRLEEALHSRAGEDDEELALDDDLASRLEDVLTDPVAAVLAGIDGPRPLPDATRARLEEALRARGRFPRWVGAAAAALIVIGGVTAGLSASSGTRGGPPAQAGRTLHSRTPTSAASTSGGSAAGARGGATANAPLSAQAPTAIVASPTGGVPRPQVAAIDPSAGPTAGGTWVIVTGSGFEGATAVTFGGTRALAFTVLSATQVRAEAPPNRAGTVDVQVADPSGTSPPVAADRFTYQAR